MLFDDALWVFLCISDMLTIGQTLLRIRERWFLLNLCSGNRYVGCGLRGPTRVDTLNIPKLHRLESQCQL